MTPISACSFGICVCIDDRPPLVVDYADSLDLSKATKLKNVSFNSDGIQWITTTLGTTASDHRDLRNISISALGIPCGTDINDDD